MESIKEETGFDNVRWITTVPEWMGEGYFVCGSGSKVARLFKVKSDSIELVKEEEDGLDTHVE